jgi:hypothetical protein
VFVVCYQTVVLDFPDNIWCWPSSQVLLTICISPCRNICSCPLPFN